MITCLRDKVSEQVSRQHCATGCQMASLNPVHEAAMDEVELLKLAHRPIYPLRYGVSDTACRYFACRTRLHEPDKSAQSREARQKAATEPSGSTVPSSMWHNGQTVMIWIRSVIAG